MEKSVIYTLMIIQNNIMLTVFYDSVLQCILFLVHTVYILPSYCLCLMLQIYLNNKNLGAKDFASLFRYEVKEGHSSYAGRGELTSRTR